MRSSHLWDVTQRGLVGSYRRPSLTAWPWKRGADRLSRNVVNYQRDFPEERESQLILPYKHEDGSLTLVETCRETKYVGVLGLWQRFT